VQSTFFIKRKGIKSYKIQQGTQKEKTTRKRRKALQRTQRPDSMEASDREEARACPSLGLVEDCRREGHRHHDLPIVDAPIALPPNRPSDQPDEGIKTFTPGFSDRLPDGAPPSSEIHGTIWGELGRRIWPRVRNHVSRLKTQSTSRWSRVSTSYAHSAQKSESFKPWRWSPSEVQHRPCSTNQEKNLHLPGIWVFQIWRAPRNRNVNTTKEEGGIGRRRGVNAVGWPLPDKPVGLLTVK
jgi:hypothetical protein